MKLGEVCAFVDRAGARLVLPFSATDAGVYGAQLPNDVRELASLAEARKVGELASVHTHDSKGAFLRGGADAATKLLEHDSKQLYPLYLTCHLTGLAPLAYTGTSVYERLIHLEHAPNEPSAVYEFSLFDDDIARRHGSLVEMFATARLEELDDDADRAAFGKQNVARLKALAKKTPAAKLSPSEDPIALFLRSRWLTIALAQKDISDLGEALEGAPGMKAFEAELSLIANRSSLAIYWLAAHALLGNDDAFAKTMRATSKSKSALVQSMRTTLEAWRAAGRKTPLGPLSGKRLGDVLAVIEDDAPAKAREPKPKATANAKSVAKRPAGKLPADVGQLITKPDPALVPLLSKLVLDGLKRGPYDKKSGASLIPALGAVRHPDALATLIAVANDTRLDYLRGTATVKALAMYDDPRVAAALVAIVTGVLRAKRGEYRASQPIAPALRALSDRRAKALPALLVRTLKVAVKKFWRDAEDAASRAAVQTKVASVTPDLVRRTATLEKWGSADVSAAIMTFAPAKGRSPLLAIWKKWGDVASGEWDDHAACVQGEVLAGLFRTSPKDAAYRACLKRIVTKRWKDADNRRRALRGALLAIESAPTPEMCTLAAKLTGFRDEHDDEVPPYESIAELARRVASLAK